jgi:hypothetical protein
MSIAERTPLLAARCATARSGVFTWFDRLFSPVDISSLVFFRIFFGAMMTYHVYAMIFKGWIAPLYIQPEMHFTYPGFGWVQPWPGQGMFLHFHVMGIAAIALTVGSCYRFATLVLAVGMAHVMLIEKAFYLNHYYLMTLLCGLMVVLPAHRACSVDAWLRPALCAQTCPAWCLWLLRFQIALPYFYGGLAKLEPDWLEGYPLGMWLNRRADLMWLKVLLGWKWTPILFSDAGLLIDLLVVPLLLWRPTRWPAYLVAITFHLMNSSLFEIGIFPWLMMGATLMFFPPDWPRRLVSRIPGIAPRIEAPVALPVRRRMATVCLLGAYVGWQALFPFRCLAYPGRAIWTEEGHHFAWHMMLREKDVGIRFYVRDPQTGTGGVVDVRSFLSSRQLSRMAKDSDMILTFVHFLRDHFVQHGKGRLQIRVLALVSLNGRKPQLMIDPNIDYARVERRWGTQPWILPLTEPLRRDPWNVPLAEWENYVKCPTPEEMIQPVESPLHKETSHSWTLVEDF